MNEKWFGLSIADIEKKLKTSAASGLSPKAARSRGNRGAGHLFYLPKKSVWRLILELLSDFSLVILLLGAAFSLAFEVEERVRGGVVLAIAVGAIAFCGIMYFRSQRMIESLSSFFYPTAKVIRGGRLYRVDFRSVVVGDVILLEKGDILCVDARIVTSDGLRVKMRLSRDEYTVIEKYADGVIAPNEQRAKEMTNMLHAGSVVLSGGARAIVTAVGKYTYLGAMTGGIQLPASDTRPKLLRKLRKQYSKINMITLISVLPFSMISLLLGNMLSERESVLSIAFLTGLAIAATTMSQLTCSLLNMYYAHKMKRLVTNDSAAVVRSVAALDKLSDADYIFMLDGCVATDGVYHFTSAQCAEGEIRSYNSLNKTARIFSEYITVYNFAATRALTTGISGAGDYFSGIEEFIKKCSVDTEALKIRCPVSSYLAGNMIDSPERVLFKDRGRSYCLNVWRTYTALQNCRTIMLGGEEQPLSAEGIKQLTDAWRKREAVGETPILFTLSSVDQAYGAECFLGEIVLNEGVDINLSRNITRLGRMGCKVISFARRGSACRLPAQLIGRGCAVKASFVRNKLPLTYNFGSIGAYSDFSDEDIIALIDYAHSQAKRVIVVGRDESAVRVGARADGFITCSDISPKTIGYLNEEIHSLELAGQNGSVNCIQSVKERADCIITRPKSGRGGLGGILAVLVELRSVYRNISDYLRYALSAQIIRLIIVACPMLFGDAILDARHVLLCSYVLDLFVFFGFMLRKGGYTNKRLKNYCKAEVLKDYFTGDSPMLVSSIVSSVVAVFLPVCADLFIGDYDYKLEGLFTSILLLHITAFIMIYYGNNWEEIKYVYKNKLLLIEILTVALLWALCFIFSPIGVLFGIEGMMPAIYLCISIVPSIVFSLIFILVTRKRQMKKF